MGCVLCVSHYTADGRHITSTPHAHRIVLRCPDRSSSRGTVPRVKQFSSHVKVKESNEHFLIYLNEQTFQGDASEALTGDMANALQSNINVVLVHDKVGPRAPRMQL